MISKRTITVFIKKCVLIYGLFLTLFILGVGDIFSRHFISMGNQIAKPVSHLGLVTQFQENNQADQSKYDIEMVFMNKDTFDAYINIARANKNTSYVDVPSFNMAFNSARQGFIPIIILLALTIATPIRFRWRKAWALFWGMILIHIYIIFKLIIWIIHTCNSVDYLGFTIADSPFWKNVLYYLYLTFWEDMPMRFIMPVLIWMLVCFRKEDILKSRYRTKTKLKMKPRKRLVS